MARIAFILADTFEDSEYRVPFDSLRAEGHEPIVVGTEAGKMVSGKKGKERVETELAASAVTADDFEALLIPGGYSPDRLRTDADMVRLVREFDAARKPLAAICHGGWMLAEAGIVEGRTVTSWPSIKTDLVNAGARWVDRELVEDRNLITSRKPEDLPAFCSALLVQLDRCSKAAEKPS
jgi:protease I